MSFPPTTITLHGKGELSMMACASHHNSTQAEAGLVTINLRPVWATECYLDQPEKQSETLVKQTTLRVDCTLSSRDQQNQSHQHL